MKESEILIKVLKKYDLRWPVPSAVQSHMAHRKKKTLKHILKSEGKLSSTSRLALPLYLTAKSRGLSLTFRQGKILTSALAAIIIAAFFVGTFLVVRPGFMATPSGGTIVFAAGQVIKTDNTGTSNITAGDRIMAGDTITTGDKSIALFQIGTSAMVRQEANSTVTISSLLSEERTTLSLTSGSVMAHIIRLIKGESFTVKAPTLVASVRGTAFSVTSGENGDTVAVDNGKVSLKLGEKPEEMILIEGQAFEKSKRSISELEHLKIQRLSRIALLKSPDRASKSELQIFQEQIRSNDATVDELIKKLQKKGDAKTIPSTLKEIQARYGHIDIITLYSAKEIKGAIISRNRNAIIMVIPGKTIRIPKNKIKHQARY